MTQFQENVYAVVSQIPKGETMTYKDVAEKLGKPKSARAVGNALNKNTNPNIPCHRVIPSSGGVGGYNRGTKKKEQILRAEGAM